MILESQWAISMLIDFGWSDVGRCSLNLGMIVNEYPIVEYRNSWMSFVFMAAIENGCMIDDVVYLPFSGSFGRIDQRHGLFVDRACLTI